MPTASYLLEVKPSASWVGVAAGHVLSVRGSWAVSVNENNGVAFGDDTEATLSAELTLAEWANTGHLIPIRYTTTVGADTTRTFTGVITRRQRDLNQMSLDAEGMKRLIGATKAYSPAFARRPVATKTTATSIEDPANASYAGGQINYLLWQSGGRPYEQSGTYPSATFYYSCDHALLAPDWSWAAGENAWDECLKMAQISGGQMYQDALGVVRYKQIVGYGGQSTSDALTESDYASVEQVEDPGIVYATRISCQYVPRRRLVRQQIADDTTPHHVEPGETETIVIEPENPIAALETATGGTQLKSEALVVAQQDGTPIAQGASGYTHTLTITAARITINVTNASSKAFSVWRVRLNGDPIVAGEAGSVYADNTPGGQQVIERTLDQSEYIQTAAAAARLCTMTLAFYAAARPIVTARGCVHKPSRAIGAALNLTVGAWSMSAQKHVILSVDHDQTGISADYTLAYVEDLPKADDFYIIGNTYTATDNKKLSW